jgi:broad specificity phosphatase PhoE
LLHSRCVAGNFFVAPSSAFVSDVLRTTPELRRYLAKIQNNGAECRVSSESSIRDLDRQGNTMAEGVKEMPAVVVTARHGERLDYVMRDSGQNWVADAERPWDTPLSDHGKVQGVKLGKHLAAELEKLQLPPISAIYTSPFFRCRQTASSARDGYNSVFSQTNSMTEGQGQLPLVRIEWGLAESINESWYRSWALPGSDGTWGFRLPGQEIIDPVTLHPASKQPVGSLLDWKATLSPSTGGNRSLDLNYASITSLKSQYCYHPKVLESRQDQRHRMMETVSKLSRPGTTVLLVSHGGPVTHLYEEMTGNHWNMHGESSFCCYSIYQQDADTTSDNKKWAAVSVNETKYLHETLTTERHV